MFLLNFFIFCVQNKVNYFQVRYGKYYSLGKKMHITVSALLCYAVRPNILDVSRSCMSCLMELWVDHVSF